MQQTRGTRRSFPTKYTTTSLIRTSSNPDTHFADSYSRRASLSKTKRKTSRERVCAIVLRIVNKLKLLVLRKLGNAGRHYLSYTEFVPSVRQKLCKLNVPEEAILILDDAPRHPEDFVMIIK
jgi:hypothetical protein